MRCQKCDRPATFHITELTGNKPQELHLCEEHARHYLSESSEGAEMASGLSESIAKNMVQQMSLSQASEELKGIDQKTCTICGLTFFDFRSRGRLGCPNDYACFEEQIDPLILGIHGESRHTGKSPKRGGKTDDPRTLLIRLRRELDEAVSQENYEQASKLRDQIKALNEK